MFYFACRSRFNLGFCQCHYKKNKLSALQLEHDTPYYYCMMYREEVKIWGQLSLKGGNELKVSPGLLWTVVAWLTWKLNANIHQQRISICLPERRAARPVDLEVSPVWNLQKIHISKQWIKHKHLKAINHNTRCSYFETLGSNPVDNSVWFTQSL